MILEVSTYICGPHCIITISFKICYICIMKLVLYSLLFIFICIQISHFQAEVYVNLLEGETVDESVVEIPSINELPAKNASEKTESNTPTHQQQQNPIISSNINISNSIQSQSTNNNNNNVHFGNNVEQCGGAWEKFGKI